MTPDSSRVHSAISICSWHGLNPSYVALHYYPIDTAALPVPVVHTRPFLARGTRPVQNSLPAAAAAAATSAAATHTTAAAAAPDAAPVAAGEDQDYGILPAGLCLAGPCCVD